MTTFICTAGTSIVTGTGLDLKHFAKRNLSEWERLDEDIEIAKQFAMDAVRKKSDPDFPRVAAELNSLIKMGLSLEDRVVLIATETIEGKLCAELVARVLREKKLCAKVDVKVIVGLQAQDGRRFQQEGLKNLIGFISQFEHGDVVFNPTGGFKSVVPYITLAGMLFNKPVKYIHEFSDDLTVLANIPITFDEELIFSIEDKLRTIDSDSYIERNEWQRGIKYADSRHDSLVEEVEGKITMSGVGLLLWERFKVDYPDSLIRDYTPPEDKKVNIYELIEVDIPPDEKHSKLGALPHHGRDIVKRLAKRIITSKYVVSILNSCSYQPHSKEAVRALNSDESKKYTQVAMEGICIATDCSTDAGFSILVKTTGRYFQETELIASILNRKYF